MEDEPWYGVRCHFSHGPSSRRTGHTAYEERIILVRASSIDEAVGIAEGEARQYANNLREVSYLEYADAFHVFGSTVGTGTEVYSLIRDSELEEDDYIHSFFQTGKECSQLDGEDETSDE